MTTSVPTPPTPLALAASLNQVLADSYALMSLTHLAHWNVEGPGFFALHTGRRTSGKASDQLVPPVRKVSALVVDNQHRVGIPFGANAG